MSDENLNEDTVVQEDELTVLKKRATQMGITFGPNTGIDTLKAKISAAMAGTSATTQAIEELENSVKANKADPDAHLSPRQLLAKARTEARKDALKLVRVNVSCMNPNKKHLEGDIFTVSNSVVGTVTKYIKFDTEDGWHIPNILLTVLREKQFQTFVVKKLENGNKTNVGKLVKEYSIDVLDPLTPEQLEELARRQALAGSID